MILGVDELQKLVKEKKLVENLSERELQNPEGAGFDVRVGEIHQIEGEGFLGVTERKTSSSKAAALYGKDKQFILEPDELVLVKTIEKVNLPDSMVALTFPRSTLIRSGVMLFTTQTAPGYSGELVYAMKNIGQSNFVLELGSRIAHIMFFEIKGKGRVYRGQWQGGRVTTEGTEKQI